MKNLSAALQKKWVAAVSVAILLLTLTGFTYVVLKDHATAEQQATYNRLADAYAANILAHVDTRLELLDKLEADFLTYQPSGRYAFESLTRPIVSLFDDIQAVNWVDPTRIVRWVTPLPGNEGAMLLNLNEVPPARAALDQVRASMDMVMTQPLDLAQGGRGVVVYQPIDGNGSANGYLNLVFRIEPLMRTATSDIGDIRYGFAIFDGDTVLFRSQSEGLSNDPVAFSTINMPGRAWRLHLLPLPTAAVSTTLTPHNVVLFIGVAFSLFLALAIHALIERQRRVVRDEARFRDFAQLNSDWFFEMDAELRYSYFSDRFAEVLGVDAANYIGKTRADVGAPGASPEAFQNHLDTMARHEPFHNFVHYRDHPEKGRVYIAISGVPVFENGAFTGYRCVGRDITKEREQEEELRKAMVTAELASQAKSEFLATMSHELRTPLNAILGFSEMIRRQYFGPIGADNYKEYAEDIHASGEHLLELINDVLDISAIEARKRAFDFKELDIETMLDDCARYFDHVTKKRAIQLNIVHGSPQPHIKADEKSIRQIFLNLISNAIKFNDDGGKVEVRTELKDGVFSVETIDSGVGIDPEILPKVTEPFARQHSDPMVAMEGTGLGLSIVKALVQKHGGDLEIDSTVGIGTTVSFWMPADRGQAAE